VKGAGKEIGIRTVDHLGNDDHVATLTSAAALTIPGYRDDAGVTGWIRFQILCRRVV
jgi:hypothetical protein